MRNLTFQSERLKVDYLAFNLQTNGFKRLQEIADYLSDQYQCNSSLIDEKDSSRKQVLVQKSKNSCKAEFRIHSVKYWGGTLLKFSGDHAERLYRRIQRIPLDWKILDLDQTNLGRIDLCYDRKLKASDQKESLKSFFKRSGDKLQSLSKNRTCEIEEKIMRIGKRGSTNYFRAYLKPNGREIRFELEVKKVMAKKVQHFLFLHQLEDFEELLVNHFYRQALLNFDMDSCYTNWLIRNFRKIRKTEVYSLNTTYLTKKSLNNFEKEEFLYRMFQLLNYLEQFEDFVTIRDEQGKIETLNIRGEIFRYIMFPVSHFVEFTGISKTNKYQSKKIRDFLNSLQELPPLVDYFSDGGFRSILAFPYLRLIRKECWYVEFAMADKLRLYRYLFQFPKVFLTYENKNDLRVKLFFLKSFSVMELEKELSVQKFLRQFAISNAKKHQLRKLILILLEEAQNSKLIQPEFILLTRTKKIKKVTKLNLDLLAQTNSIFYFENP